MGAVIDGAEWFGLPHTKGSDLEITRTRVKSILTRASGYLEGVCSHSLQPYCGCPLGSSLCGVGCYVRHAAHLTRGREWGRFLEVRENAAEAYLAGYDRERAWGRSNRGGFVIFLSSATEPFHVQEGRFAVTRSVLEAMLEKPPDGLIVQTHSPMVVESLGLLGPLSHQCELRVHLSIETDRDRLPGLPPPASPVARRFEAARRLKDAGLRVVITVSPLLPIADPEAFFARVAASADAVVLDHFIEGDGSRNGSRTLRTPLPEAMAQVAPGSVALAYREQMAVVADRHLPGRVGVGRDGFAGRFTTSG